MDISSYTQAQSTMQLSYGFRNIDIIASNCKYVSGIAPLDSYDMPIINSNNALSAISSAAQTNPGPDGFAGLHITNFQPPAPNNATFPTTQHSYRCSDLYIINNKTDNSVSLVHKVKQVGEPLAELIIKHNPNVSTDPILYLCFFIAAQKNENAQSQPNEIDNIINFVTSTNDSSSVLSTSISFNIPSQKSGVQFIDKMGNVVIIMTNPISVNKTSQELLSQFNSSGNPTALPSWLNDNNKPTNAFQLMEANIMTSVDDNVYMECVPTGQSSESIKAYNVPINSEYTEKASQIEFMGNTMKFSFVIFGVFILYALFPSFWAAVTQKVGPSNNVRLDSAEFWYYVFLISIGGISFILGAVFGFDRTHIMTSLLCIFILILTSFIILFNRRIVQTDHYPFKDIDIWPITADSFGGSDVIQVFLGLFPSTLTELYENKGSILGVLILTVAINLAIIAVNHQGKLPTEINGDPKTPSSDPSVMNLLELIDIILGDVFALVALRSIYVIYSPE